MRKLNYPKTVAELTDMKKNGVKIIYPVTVGEAVCELIARLSAKDKTFIASLKESDLITLHHTLGRCIRNEFGLWEGNQKLLKSCRRKHPDNASSVILASLWKKFQTSTTV